MYVKHAQLYVDTMQSATACKALESRAHRLDPAGKKWPMTYQSDEGMKGPSEGACRP